MNKIEYLDNGLGILALKAEPNKCLNINIFYAVGAADELIGKSGVAHFLEHLSFKSTTDFKAGEFDRILKSLGASNNACTSSDYTHYYAYSHKAHAQKILELYSSMMSNLAFKQDEFEAEKLVILEEERLSVANNPFGKLWFRLHNEVYKNSALASATIGFADEINQLSQNDVMSFYEQFYAPNNALIILSGDCDEQIVQSAKRIFADKSVKQIRKNPKIFCSLNSIKCTETFEDLENEIFALAYKIPSFNHPDFLGFNALARYLNLEHSSPLITKFVKELKMCCDIECYAHASRHEGLFIIFGTCSSGQKAEDVISELIKYFDRSLLNVQVDLLNNFLELDAQETLSLPKQLAALLGSSWAMGDINAALNLLDYKISDRSLKPLEKYFTNEFSIILKDTYENN